MNRQKKALLSLFALLLLAVGYSYWMMPEQQHQSPQPNEAGSESVKSSQKRLSLVGKNALRIDLLEKEATPYKGDKRDIFNFAVISKKPAVKSKPKPPVAKPQVKPRPTPVVTPVVRQQLALFTLNGFLIKGELLIVFLSRGEETFLVKEGDQFGDNKQFNALSITREKMIINQVNDSRAIEIQLIEKEPLVPTMQQSGVTNSQQRSPLVQSQWPNKTVPNNKNPTK